MNTATPNLGERAITAALWRLSGNGAQTLLQLLVVLLLARLLEPRVMGLVTAALAVTKFADLFWQLGLGEALIQRPVLEKRHLTTAFTVSLVSGAGFALPLWLAAPALAAWFGWPELAPILRALAWLFPLNGLGVTAEALLRRELQFRELAVIELCANFLGTGVTGVTLAWCGYGVNALVGAALAQALVKTCLLLARRPPSGVACEWAACRDLANFGGGFTLTRVCNYFALQGDNLVVGHGLGAEALGLYSRAYSLMNNCVALFAKVLDEVLFAALSRMQDDATRMREAYQRSVRVLTLLVLPVSAGLVVLAPEIVRLLLGAQWSGAIEPFRVFAGAIILRSGYKISISVARAQGAVYALAWRQAVYGILTLVLAWLGVRGGGLRGVAWGVTVAMAANHLMLAQLSLKLLGLRGRDFLRWHLAAVPAMALAGLTAWGAATQLRALTSSDWLICSGTAGAVALALLTGTLAAPRPLWGTEGASLAQLINKRRGKGRSLLMAEARTSVRAS